MKIKGRVSIKGSTHFIIISRREHPSLWMFILSFFSTCILQSFASFTFGFFKVSFSITISFFFILLVLSIFSISPRLLFAFSVPLFSVWSIIAIFSFFLPQPSTFLYVTVSWIFWLTIIIFSSHWIATTFIWVTLFFSTSFLSLISSSLLDVSSIITISII